MKFLDKFLESLPWVNKWLLFEKKRVATIIEGKEQQAPSRLRTTVNIPFFRNLQEQGKLHVHESFCVKGSNPDSNSMNPGIDGHMVMLVHLHDKAPYRYEDLKVGDIIWFYRRLDKQNNVLHRIIRMEDGYVVARGDNNAIQDGIIMKEDIYGVCVGVLY